ncbi:hypothetical protein CMETHOX_25110 [Lacrimispora indolis]|nr:hypothetical protein CMETHOX_25110 [[Clostridium] methoxybenzovorans]
MTRKWKIINSLIAWLIFFSLVQPAYGAWDTLTAEVTFTAQTGVWMTDPAPTPAAEPAAASATPQAVSAPEAPAPAAIPEPADTPEPEEPTVTPAPAPTPETPADPTPESPEIPTPQENSEAE